MTLSNEFRKVMDNTPADPKMLVPLLIWCSGYEKNIELCQAINRKFYKGEPTILMLELALGNKLKHFIKYPKVPKEDEKTKFFYNDICKYFDWTKNELDKNIDVINIEELKSVIAQNFGYDNKERKSIGLKKLEGIKGDKKKETIVQKKSV
jgi:hypothetical protein